MTISDDSVVVIDIGSRNIAIDVDVDVTTSI